VPDDDASRRREESERLEAATADEGSLPVAPSLGPVLEREDAADWAEAAPPLRAPEDEPTVDRRTVLVVAMAVAIAVAAGLVAQLLISLIGLVTNIAFYGRVSTAFVSPGTANAPALVVLVVPLVGALIVGLMARFGAKAIRGHGIPEVMERVLFGESRIPARVMFLKPLSAAIAIGTGGPFGAEGPIIATGGALGSLFGQLFHVTADERKTLLAAGAAAGMAATFGSPVSAALLAVELLLFEYRPRSLIPVALAAATATGVRIIFEGTAPVFPIPEIAQPSDVALAMYALLGAVIGAIAAGVTRLAYGIEDAFESLGERYGVHWMWWPAIGAVAVGVIGVIEPRTLGVGYDNITGALGGSIVGTALLALVVLKLISWAIYLGSGTSGGTLAPLFTIGGGLGALAGAALASVAPGLGVSPTVAGLVGMAAIFAGASHALLASVVFAFETTRQPIGLLPLLAGCSAAYLVSLLVNRHSIMTEKLARRGARIRTEYAVDHLAHVLVRDVATRDVVSLRSGDSVEHVRAWITSGAGGTTHHGFPVVDPDGLLVGVVTRRDILEHPAYPGALIDDAIGRPPAVVFEDSTLREAADHMVREHVGRLPVVRREAPRVVVGVITRSDLLSAHATRLHAATHRTGPRPAVPAGALRAWPWRGKSAP
jgi:H+/Cl- antiporter ClcA/CBS domain-containing protein